MRAIATPQTNLHLGAPLGWEPSKDGPCVSLPVYRDGLLYFSWWQFSWRERLRVMLGFPLRLCVFGSGQPPVAIEITGVDR
jgi:hypothetical protein